MEPSPPEVSFEQAIARLEVVVEEIEAGDLSLEDSLRRYEEGVALYRRCLSALDAAQRKIELLSAEEGLDSDPQPGEELEEDDEDEPDDR